MLYYAEKNRVRHSLVKFELSFKNFKKGKLHIGERKV
jgi:hypothetical protein